MNIVIKFGKRVAGIAVGTVLAVALSACASSAASPGADATAVSVVASTNVYGDLVEQIAGKQAGRAVRVTSIIDDLSIDPHSYEANARTGLAISHADVIIENGGGYDDFVDRLRAAADSSATVLNVVDISGHARREGGELNEHVWYDLPTVRHLVARIATALIDRDPDHAAAYRSNATALDARVAGLQRTAAAIKVAYAGTAVAVTEPVPLYLLTACGLVNKTPAGFSAAVEEGGDVAANVLNETLALVRQHHVALLVYNEQTSGPATTRVLAAANAHDVPTVPVTETLPGNTHYVAWMSGILADIRAALAR